MKVGRPLLWLVPNLLDCESRLQLGGLAVRGSQHPGYVVISYIVSFLALL